MIHDAPAETSSQQAPGTRRQSPKPNPPKTKKPKPPKRNNDNTMSNHRAQAAGPTAGKDSDLRAAAAGLLSVRKATPSNNAIDKSIVYNGKPFPTDVTECSAPVSSNAAGLRSLQAVESILKSRYPKAEPPNRPQGVNGGEMSREEEIAWKRARSRLYTQRNRSRKKEQIALLMQGIIFFKQKLGEPNNNLHGFNKQPKRGGHQLINLPSEEQMRNMTEREVSEWKKKERLKRKRESNAASLKEQEQHTINLAIEHEMLHDRYRQRCKEIGIDEQDWWISNLPTVPPPMNQEG